MLLFPKNRRYKSEPWAKTLFGPIIILIFCLIASFVWNPLFEPQMASLFGIDKKVTITVDKVREIDARFNVKSAGWRCLYWRAYAELDGRKLQTKACFENAPKPAIGDELEVAIAPMGSDAYLLSRGEPSNAGTLIFAWLLLIAIIYSTALSIRLLYIGYSSNWFAKDKLSK
jgi:hypothetical protein